MAQIRKYQNAGTVDPPQVDKNSSEEAAKYGKIIFDGEQYAVTDDFISAIENFSPQAKSWVEDLKSGKNRYIYTTDTGYSFANSAHIAKEHAGLNDRQEIKMGIVGKGGRKVRNEKANWHELGQFIQSQLKKKEAVKPEEKKFELPGITVEYAVDSNGNISFSETDLDRIRHHFDTLKKLKSETYDKYTFWNKDVTLDGVKSMLASENIEGIISSITAGKITSNDIANAKNFGITLTAKYGTVDKSGNWRAATSEEAAAIRAAAVTPDPDPDPKTDGKLTESDPLYKYISDPNKNYFFGEFFRLSLNGKSDPTNGKNYFVIGGKKYAEDSEELKNNETYQKFVENNKNRNYRQSEALIHWDWINYLDSIFETSTDKQSSLYSSYGPWALDISNFYEYSEDPNATVYKILPGKEYIDGNDMHGFNMTPIQTIAVNNHGMILAENIQEVEKATPSNLPQKKNFFNREPLNDKSQLVFKKFNADNLYLWLSYNPDDKKYYITFKNLNGKYQERALTYQEFLEAFKLDFKNSIRQILEKYQFNEYLKKNGGIIKAQKGVFRLPTQPTQSNTSNTSEVTGTTPKANPTPGPVVSPTPKTDQKPVADAASIDNAVKKFNLVGDEQQDALEQECARGWTTAQYYDLASIIADIGALGLSWVPDKGKYGKAAQFFLDLGGTGTATYAQYLRDDKEMTARNWITTGVNLTMDLLNAASNTKGGQAVFSKIYQKPIFSKIVSAGKIGLYGVAGVQSTRILFDDRADWTQKARAAVSLVQLASAGIQGNTNKASLKQDANGNYTITSVSGKKMVFTPAEFEAFQNAKGVKRLEILHAHVPRIKSKQALTTAKVNAARRAAARQGVEFTEDMRTAAIAKAEEAFNAPENLVPLAEFGIKASKLNDLNVANWIKNLFGGPKNVQFDSTLRTPQSESTPTVLMPFQPWSIDLNQWNQDGEGNVQVNRKGGKILKCDKGTPGDGVTGVEGNPVNTGKKETPFWWDMLKKGIFSEKGETVFNNAARLLTDLETARKVHSDLKKANSARSVATKSFIPHKTRNVDLSFLQQVDKANEALLSNASRFAKTQADNKLSAQVYLDTNRQIGDLRSKSAQQMSSEISQNALFNNENYYKTELENINRGDYNNAFLGENTAKGYEITAQWDQAKGQSVYKLLHERAQELAVQRKENAFLNMLKNESDQDIRRALAIAYKPYNYR